MSVFKHIYIEVTYLLLFPVFRYNILTIVFFLATHFQKINI